MGTTIRPELSIRNKYHIEKHRYYELKHFCLQYPLWKKTLLSLTEIQGIQLRDNVVTSKEGGNPTALCAEERIFYTNRISMVEQTAKATDDTIGNYILKAVTEGLSYDYLKLRLEIPCCKDTYYELYRKFFKLLSAERQ